MRATSGTTVDPDDPLLHEKERPNAITIRENCYVEPNRLRTLDVLHYDTNYYKTELHKGFNLEEGVRGSLNLFGREADGVDIHDDRHLPFAQHCNTERPERIEGKKKKKTKIVWTEKMHQPDNEYFDNSTCCLALLVAEGLTLEIGPIVTEDRSDDMQEFLNQQKNRKLL